MFESCHSKGNNDVHPSEILSVGTTPEMEVLLDSTFVPTFLPHPFVEKLNTLRVFKTSPQVHHFEKKKNSAISPYYPTGNEHISHLTGWNRENYELKNSTRDGIWVNSQGSHFSWLS